MKQIPVMLLVCSLCLILSACVTTAPRNPNNLCSIFQQNKSWYRSAQRSVNKWGGSIPVAMSIMYQESTYKRKAKPAMRYFLGLIPLGRPSTAYGYAQAIDSTWAQYQQEANARSASRTNFADSVDFIFWYMHKTYTTNGISKWDGFQQYLNYHEGHGGFSRGTYQNKGWLINTAQRVDERAKQFSTQITHCNN